jgi:hypothetical protein
VRRSYGGAHFDLFAKSDSRASPVLCNRSPEAEACSDVTQRLFVANYAQHMHYVSVKMCMYNNIRGYTMMKMAWSV